MVMMGVDDDVARRRMMLKIFTSRWRIIYKTNANWTLFRIKFLFINSRPNFATGNRNPADLVSSTHSLDPSFTAAHTDWALGWAYIPHVALC